MATRYPPEFRQRAVELARRREKPITQLAADLGISGATLHGWLKQAGIDEGRREGLTRDERVELVRGLQPTLHPSRGHGVGHRLRAASLLCSLLAPTRRQFGLQLWARGSMIRRTG